MPGIGKEDDTLAPQALTEAIDGPAHEDAPKTEGEDDVEARIEAGLKRLLAQGVARHITIKVPDGPEYSGTLVPDLRSGVDEYMANFVGDEPITAGEELDIMHRLLNRPTAWLFISPQGETLQIVSPSDDDNSIRARDFALAMSDHFGDGAQIVLRNAPGVTGALAALDWALDQFIDTTNCQYGYASDGLDKDFKYAQSMAEYVRDALVQARRFGERRAELIEEIGADEHGLQKLISRTIADALSPRA